MSRVVVEFYNNHQEAPVASAETHPETPFSSFHKIFDDSWGATGRDVESSAPRSTNYDYRTTVTCHYRIVNPVNGGKNAPPRDDDGDDLIRQPRGSKKKSR